MNFEQILIQYCKVLEKHQRQLSQFGFDINQIQMVRNTFSKHDSYFSYEFTNLRLWIPKSMLPSHSIPRTFDYLQIILSLEDEVQINIIPNNYVTDPFRKLEKFNIILYSENQNFTASWHLDRHVNEDTDGETSYIHPVYHMTFGGYHMENIDNEEPAFGKALILRTPRMMHPPMEILLGIDFILNHFIPKNELDVLSDASYKEVIHKLKKYFWLPFSLAFAKNYCERIAINNNINNFDDSFVREITG